VFEVVEHEERFTVAEGGNQRFADQGSTCSKAERHGDVVGDQSGIGDRGERHEANVVAPCAA